MIQTIIVNLGPACLLSHTRLIEDIAINNILTQRKVSKETAVPVSMTFKQSQSEFDAWQSDTMTVDNEDFNALGLEAVKDETDMSLWQSSEGYTVEGYCNFANKLEAQDCDTGLNSNSKYFDHNENYASTMKVGSPCASLASHWYPTSRSYRSA